jgi:hypothetical protein
MKINGKRRSGNKGDGFLDLVNPEEGGEGQALGSSGVRLDF